MVSTRLREPDISNQSADFTYVKTANDFGPLLSNCNITAFSNTGDGEIIVSSDDHQLVTGNVVVFGGGTPYDGVNYKVIRVDDNNFKFTETFTSTGTGNWTAKKRQCFSRLQTKRFFYIQSQIFHDAPLLLTAENGEPVEYVFKQDDQGFNGMFFNYTDPTLGSPFQGENLFSLTRYSTFTFIGSALSAANIKVMDVGFTNTSFEFCVDNNSADFGGVLIRDVVFYRSINSATYFLFDEGLRFSNCQSIRMEGAIFNPNATQTGPVIEITETGSPTRSIFTGLDGLQVESGNDFIKIPSGLDADSRVLVTDCDVPTNVNLFDSSGLNETDVKVTTRDNIGFPDSTSIGSMIVSANTTVISINTEDTWVDLDLGGKAIVGSNNEAWTLTDTTTGEMRCDTVNEFVGQLTATFVVEPNGSKRYNFRILKNGSVLPDSSTASLAISGTVVTIPFVVPLTAVNGDLIRFQIFEEEGTDDPLITDLTLVLQ